MKPQNRVVYVLFAILIASIVGCASTSTSEGTGEYVDNSVITTKVKTAILREPGLETFDIHVDTFKGVVELSGTVDSQSDIDKAVAIARSVKGVRGVKNNLRHR